MRRPPDETKADPEVKKKIDAMLSRLGLFTVEWGRMLFEIVGEIIDIETIASGGGIRRLKVLRKRYGGRHWRKQKGIASVRLANGSIRRAEVHWYEAHGVGRRGWKIKHFVDEP